jgi:DNA segregation ATPase FtsK/SpoIIIE-like protein
MLTYNIPTPKPIDTDSMYDDAVKLVQETGKASSSLIQRKLKLGYARSAYLLDQMEQNGIVGPANGAKPREILIPHNVEGEMVIPKKRPEIVEEEIPEELASWKKTKYANDKSDSFEVEVGLDKDNKKVILNLSKYQNLLVVGNKFTGVVDFLNNVLATSMAKYSPDELKIIAMDGIRNDLIVPNKIPHLLVPTIVDLEKGISALKWAVCEVERRLKTFAELGEQDIKEWNHNTGFTGMPNIMIVINSLDQFLLFSPGEIEDNICRLILTGKKAGVFFVIGSDPMILRRYKTILSNNAAKLVFKTVDKNTAKSFGTPEAVDLDSPDKAILNVLFEENKIVDIEKIEPKKIYEEIFK